LCAGSRPSLHCGPWQPSLTTQTTQSPRKYRRGIFLPERSRLSSILFSNTLGSHAMRDSRLELSCNACRQKGFWGQTTGTPRLHTRWPCCTSGERYNALLSAPTRKKRAMTIEKSVLKKLPKVLLHEHLDGVLRPGTVIELAQATGYRDLPTSDPRLWASGFFKGRPKAAWRDICRGSSTRLR
jgi:hypothetical protein